jgi:branched-chain amino acid transport system substrate-binding protein
MKRSNKMLVAPGLLAIIALMIAACGPVATTEAPITAPTQAPVTEVKIAFFGPLTGGGGSAIGLEQLALARLAVADFNAKMSGSNFHIALVEEDTGSTPDKAVPVCQKDANDPTILAVIGPFGSGQVMACADILEKARLAHITSSATNPALSTGGYKTFFRVVANDDVQGYTDGNYIADKLGARNVYILDDKGPYGAGLADTVEKILKAKGVTTQHDGVDQTQIDFSAQVTKIKAFKADIVFFASGHAPQGATLARQLRELGLKVPVFGGDAFHSQELYIDSAGGATEGSFASDFFPNIRRLPEAADLVKAADAASSTWGNYGAASYVATTVVLQGVAATRTANNLTRAGVLDAISRTDTKIFGIPIKFDPTGEVVGATYVIDEVTNGKFKQIFP